MQNLLPTYLHTYLLTYVRTYTHGQFAPSSSRFLALEHPALPGLASPRIHVPCVVGM